MNPADGPADWFIWAENGERTHIRVADIVVVIERGASASLVHVRGCPVPLTMNQETVHQLILQMRSTNAGKAGSP